jgi:hypothetical protein
MVAGEHVAELEPQVLDRLEKVTRQAVAFPQQQQVALRGSAVRRAAGGQVSAAAGGPGGVPLADRFTDGRGQRGQMAVENFRQQRVQVREVAAHGGRGHAQGQRKVSHGDAGPAEPGKQRNAGGDNPLLLLPLLVREPVAGARQIVGMGAEEAGRDDVHGRRVGNIAKARQHVFFVSLAAWRKRLRFSACPA